MKLINRFILVIVVCVVGLAVQTAVFGYLDQANLPAGKPTAPLVEFPYELRTGTSPTAAKWVGKDQEKEKYDFADDSILRDFENSRTRQQIRVWMVYSDCGEDREHNPVVCHGVAGAIEDLEARQPIEVPGHAAPVQQYRFTSGGRGTLVYHWYYTLPSPDRRKLSTVQKVYSEIRRPPGSMTIELFVPEPSEGDARPGALELVKLVDAAVQPLVGPSAVRGSARRPIKVVPPRGDVAAH